MRHLFLLIILVLVGCESSDLYKNQANKDIENNNFLGAIDNLNKAIELDDKNIDLYIKRGYCKSMTSDNIGAVDDYERVLKMDDHNVFAYYQSALNKDTLKNFGGALFDITIAIVDKGNGLDGIYRKRNNFEYNISMAELKSFRGKILYKMKRYKEAYLEYKFCIDEGFNLTESYYWSGVILLNLGDQKNGCDNLIKAKELGDQYSQEIIDKYCQ